MFAPKRETENSEIGSISSTKAVMLNRVTTYTYEVVLVSHRKGDMDHLKVQDTKMFYTIKEAKEAFQVYLK